MRPPLPLALSKISASGFCPLSRAIANLQPLQQGQADALLRQQ